MSSNLIKDVKKAIDDYIIERKIDRNKDSLLWSIVTNDLQEAWRITYNSASKNLISDDAGEIVSVVNYCMRKIPTIARGSLQNVLEWTKDFRTSGQVEREALQ